jgi:2-alkyl-3-oxoalkanoate reductase
MRTLIAGASDALGKRLIPLLAQAGHEIIGTTRSDIKAPELRRLGAHPLTVNALDRATVAATNELRTTGLDYLMDPAITAGARRSVAQSFTGWTNPRNGAGLRPSKTPSTTNRPSRQARRWTPSVTWTPSDERQPSRGVALRYGMFYGPGNTISKAGE